MMEKLKNNKTLNLIIEIILVLIIVILLIHSCVIQKMNDEEGKKKTPTGNVDIIEIVCDNSKTCNKKTSNDKTKSDKNTKKNTSSTVLKPNNTEIINEVEEEPQSGLVTVDDYTVKWDGNKDLKIFTNSAYELTDRISPESSNTYKFIVKNKTEYKLKYKITFTETNTQSINMKYKLKKNDTYLVTEYTTYNNLNVLDQEIESGENDTYYLDWKWFSSSNDTHIGEIQADYSLKIYIEAENIA